MTFEFEYLVEWKSVLESILECESGGRFMKKTEAENLVQVYL
jgi:hypothetical protein